ncbi:uncharacterized protein [Palaemon carinicauda]|uniref:uncharacterized protein n=1 Tax=Palaemon carinicauda TaxID=392227 RepID=UPI0035B695F0
MYQLQEKLSPHLYGFLPQRSTLHCLAELYSRLSSKSVVAFLDLKSAFDIANRDIILDQLVEFGVRGNLLKWINSYLSNRKSRVFFKGVCSSYEKFEHVTPQGGVLSLFLFNILMHRVLFLLAAIPGTTVTCYADDVCIHSTTHRDLQRVLQDFYRSCTSCGLILSPDKKAESSLRRISETCQCSLWVGILYLTAHSIHIKVHQSGLPLLYLCDNEFTPWCKTFLIDSSLGSLPSSGLPPGPQIIYGPTKGKARANNKCWL